MTTLAQNKQLDGISFIHVISSVLAKVQHWMDVASQRKQLAELDPRMLQDMGLDITEVSEEIKKPFWK